MTRRDRRARWAPVVSLTAILLGAAPTGADPVHPSPGASWTHSLAPDLLGGALVVTTVALAGLLAAAVIIGPLPWPARARRAERCLALVAAGCDVAVLGRAGLLGGALGGWPALLAVAHLGLILASTAGHGRPPWASAALSGALCLTIGVAGHAGWVGRGQLVEVGVGVVHLGAAALWVGGVAYLVLGWRRTPEGRAWLAAATRRFGPAAAVAVVTTVGTGLWNMDIHGAWSSELLGSAYGRTLVTKTALVAVALGAAGVLRHSARPARRRPLPQGSILAAEAAVFGVVLALASALVVLPPPLASRDPGVSVLRRVRLAGAWLTASVGPQRPGDNLLELMGAAAPTVSVRLRGRDVPLGPYHDGARSGVLVLPPGRSTLWLSAGSTRARLTLDTGRAEAGAVRIADVMPIDGPDRAECASRHLGHLVALAEAGSKGRSYQLLSSVVRAGRVRPPPSLPPVAALLGACDEAGGFAQLAARRSIPVFGGPATLLPEDAVALEVAPSEAGAAFVRFLARHGLRRVLIVADDSQRARDFAGHAVAVAGQTPMAVDVVGPTFGAQGLPSRPDAAVPDAMVIATGWADARRVLAAFTRPPAAPPSGIYLASWLLNPELLSGGLGPDVRQISVGVSLAPNSAPAHAYLRALSRFSPGAIPTGPGMVGYLEGRLAIADPGLRRAGPPRSPLGGSGATTAAPTSDRPSRRLQFFTPIRLGFLPAALDAGHSDGQGPGWIPGATLAPLGDVASRTPEALRPGF